MILKRGRKIRKNHVVGNKIKWTLYSAEIKCCLNSIYLETDLNMIFASVLYKDY